MKKKNTLITGLTIFLVILLSATIIIQATAIVRAEEPINLSDSPLEAQQPEETVSIEGSTLGTQSTTAEEGDEQTPVSTNEQETSPPPYNEVEQPPLPPYWEDDELPPLPDNEWYVEDTGTYFEVTDNDYLNLTLISSEPVHVHLEVIPRMVSFVIEDTNSANSTLLTFSGFKPNTTYYRYQDGFKMENFTTD
jgi:hypothetical protein